MDVPVHIQFAYNGTYFKAEVFPLENESYRVEYKTSGLELKPKIIFIKRGSENDNLANSWQQMNEGANVQDGEFIDAIGWEIETSLEI